MHADWRQAIERGDAAMLDELARNGADVNARDRFGQTGLMLAARNGQRAAVSSLIAHGAQLDVTAKYGLSALMLAVVNGHSEIARDLAAARGLHELALELAP